LFVCWLAFHRHGNEMKISSAIAIVSEGEFDPVSF